MKKHTALLATSALVCALALSSSAMAGTTMPSGSASKNANTVTSKQQGALYSFVIEASGAQLKQVKGNSYSLTIPVANIKSVLAFSQAPTRAAKSMTPTEYAKMVHSGDDSFDKNPPNMAVTFDNGVSDAFEINSFSKDNLTITYNLTLLDHQEGPSNQSGHVSLFIDATYNPFTGSFNPN